MLTETKEKIIDSLTVENFTKWLNRYSPSYEVGERCDSTSCPIAYYLNEVIGEDREINEVSVEANHIAVYALISTPQQDEWDLETIPMPLWASQFVNFVDCADDEGWVTQAECVEYLNQIKEPENVHSEQGAIT